LEKGRKNKKTLAPGKEVQGNVVPHDLLKTKKKDHKNKNLEKNEKGGGRRKKKEKKKETRTIAEVGGKTTTGGKRTGGAWGQHKRGVKERVPSDPKEKAKKKEQ